MTIRADPKAMRDFEKRLKSFEKALDEQIRSLRSSLGRLEQGWPDSEGRMYCQTMRETIRGLEKLKSQIPDLIKTLDSKATPLEIYKNG